MSDLVPLSQEQNLAPTVHLLDHQPKNMVVAATEIANVLKDVIDKQKLYVDLNGNRHVKAAGWSFLGNMLGILPREDKVIFRDDGSCEAYISLINNKTGLVVGGGSGYVGMDENNWKSKPTYARRSMAITRATSKAYKNCFSWIVSLAGYEVTPAEEMEGLNLSPQQEKPKTEQRRVAYDGSPQHKKELAKIFSDNAIEDKEERSKIHHALINWKIPFERDYLEAGVIEALKQIKEHGKCADIPF